MCLYLFFDFRKLSEADRTRLSALIFKKVESSNMITISELIDVVEASGLPVTMASSTSCLAPPGWSKLEDFMPSLVIKSRGELGDVGALVSTRPVFSFKAYLRSFEFDRNHNRLSNSQLRAMNKNSNGRRHKLGAVVVSY